MAKRQERIDSRNREIDSRVTAAQKIYSSWWLARLYKGPAPV